MGQTVLLLNFWKDTTYRTQAELAHLAICRLVSTFEGVARLRDSGYPNLGS